MRPASLISAVFIGLVAVGHLVRFILQVEVLVGGYRIPGWASVLAFLLLGTLAACLVLEQRSRAAK